MRRKDREITDRSELEAILSEAQACRIAFATGGAPYIVALSFGFSWEEELRLYFHGAREGRKIELMRRGGLVGFQLESGVQLVTGAAACDWGMRYKSIVGSGRLEEVLDPEERRLGLDHVMTHYGFAGEPGYNPGSLGATTVLRLRVAEMTGKRRA
ncbi:MAG: pyridoxamine 5'-phosphate oxidase family protein [Treponema sp.]|nr:pyridoxamine 5'-phosphate oxidase family protein [Treponema sp.]